MFLCVYADYNIAPKRDVSATVFEQNQGTFLYAMSEMKLDNLKLTYPRPLKCLLMSDIFKCSLNAIWACAKYAVDLSMARWSA